jgi:membrane fusion protein (multidrug efflux system)
MSDSETTAAEAELLRAERLAKRRLWLTRLAMVLAAAAALWLLWYLLFGRNHTSTDDAYVNAEVAQVTPLYSAAVTAVHVRDTDVVKPGDVLVELDPTNARIALAQAEADLVAAQRRFRQALANGASLGAQVGARDADVSRAEAQLAAAQADFDKARIDLSRREALAAGGGVSGEELSAAKRGFASAQAGVAAARAALAEARAATRSAAGQQAANDALVKGLTEATDPGVLAAKARLDAARVDLDRTVIRAAIGGVVTRRQVQVGQRVTVGTPVMTIVPTGQVYVEANFKERQLRRMKVGQPAEVVADIYGGGVTYHGRVAGLGGGTGSAMAVLPAQNATGNWIKVVQRLPVRIELDPRELAEHPLRVGLSTEVTVDLSGN